MTDVCNGEENTSVYFENFVDSEPLATITYTPFNVAGPGCESDPCEIVYTGCACGQKSCDEDCPCIMGCLGQSYDESGCLLSGNKPVVECNSHCNCGQACTNRVVQNGISFRLEIFRTDQKGWGLRALENIPKDRFVCEYAGEVIGFEEACRRAAKMSEEDSNYILILNEHLQGGKILKTCVDPANIGNVGRYINHSCDPNLYMVAVRVDNEVPKLALFAKREILDEEELSFDYAGETIEPRSHQASNTRMNGFKDKGEYTTSKPVGSFCKPCFCGAGNCRGLLPFDKDLYSELQDVETEFSSDSEKQDSSPECEDYADLWDPDLTDEDISHVIHITAEFEIKYEGSKYVNHSGGAVGSDLFWQEMSSKYGIRTCAYSFKGHGGNNPARVELSYDELRQANQYVERANKTLRRVFPTQNNFINNLLRRDWFQVKDTEAVFAVSKIAKTWKTVEGGTGWTVQMAIDAQKPVYVFDCKIKRQSKVTDGTCIWYKFNYKLGKFVPVIPPVLTFHFSGIGTRDLPERGKSAIREVFCKTFEKQ